MKIKLGEKVFHKDIYDGKEEMKIVGIRENTVELEGDYSGGTHNVIQRSWFPIEGLVSLSVPKEDLSVQINYPEIGRKYQHYKGGLYKVITLAKHSETDEILVIYKSLLFGSIHARPLNMWFEEVRYKIKSTTYTGSRFTRI